MQDLSPYHFSKGHPAVSDTESDDPLSRARFVDVDEVPGLRSYWQLLKKHKRKIAVCVAAAVACALVIVLSMTPLYTAKTVLLIERYGPKVINVQPVLSESVESSASDADYYQSQYEILKSRSLAAAVIKSQGLDKNPIFTGEGRRKNVIEVFNGLLSKATAWMRWGNQAEVAGIPSDVKSESINAYQGMLDVEAVKRSRLVRISISSPSPALSASIANAHAQAYVRQGIRLKSQASEQARKFLETELTGLKQRVEESEAALNQFRRGKGIISLDDKENIVVDRLADLNKRLTEAEADRIGLEAQARLIKQREYDSLPAVVSSPLIQNLKAQMVQLEAQYANLAAQFKPGYPQLAQLRMQLDETKQKLGAQIKNVVESINSAYMAAAGKERQLRVEMNNQKSAALALKDASVDYAILSREASTNSQLYDSVLARLKELALSSEIPASNVSVVDLAEVPLWPSEPRKRLTVMLAAALGLVAGFGLALVSEHLDNTLRTPEDVERHLRLANLVVVPDFFSLPKNATRWKLPFTKRKPAFDSKLCVPSKSAVPANLRFTLITEAYRKLRTAILYSRPGQPPKTILFTSSTAGEGKTISVTNTAIMFAHLGYNCLVIDADLRRPQCHRALRVNNDRGLTDFLVGQAAMEQVIKRTSVANLSVLNCGAGAPNPAELIGSQKMQDGLKALKQCYDFILIDSPPVIPVSDAVILATLVDGVVFVVRGQDTPKNWVKGALAELNSGRAKLLGVVLNRVDLRSADYQGYYQYYDGEYYSSVRLA
ncbi:MAG: GumC family protein [Candidatus Binatia bacterium]